MQVLPEARETKQMGVNSVRKYEGVTRHVGAGLLGCSVRETFRQFSITDNVDDEYAIKDGS